MTNKLKVLPDDIKFSIENEIVNICNTPGQSVINRNHGKISHPFPNDPKSCIKGDTGYCLKFGIRLPAGKIRVGTGHALKSYCFVFPVFHSVYTPSSYS